MVPRQTPRSIAMSVSVTLSVCLSVCWRIENHTSKVREIFCKYFVGPWLGPLLTTMKYVMYFRFCFDDCMFSHNSRYGAWHWQYLSLHERRAGASSHNFPTYYSPGGATLFAFVVQNGSKLRTRALATSTCAACSVRCNKSRGRSLLSTIALSRKCLQFAKPSIFVTTWLVAIPNGLSVKLGVRWSLKVTRGRKRIRN